MGYQELRTYTYLGNQQGFINYLALTKDHIVSTFKPNYDTLVVWKFDHFYY
jgi:hypothetical protein